jgi:hypothetical protein
MSSISESIRLACDTASLKRYFQGESFGMYVEGSKTASTTTSTTCEYQSVVIVFSTLDSSGSPEVGFGSSITMKLVSALILFGLDLS